MPFSTPRMSAQLIVGFLDRSDERSNATIYVPDDKVIVDAGGNNEPDDTDIQAWLASLAAVCDFQPTQYAIRTQIKLSPSNGFGQREQKYLLTYVDTVSGDVGDSEIPCRDASIVPPLNTDYYDLTVAPWVAFKNAFEALAVSKLGNPVLLQKVKLMGKNN